MATETEDLPAIPPTPGIVLEAERGSLPFALIHGEALVACAAWALGDAGITPVDIGTPWEALVEAGELGQALVLHDALCPMTPARFLVECVQTALSRGAVVVGVRPVTDTVKQVDEGYVGATLDRDDLAVVTSPVVLPPAVLAVLDAPPPSDLTVLAGVLAARFPVLTLVAPPEGRRVGSLDEVRLLEALTRPGGG